MRPLRVAYVLLYFPRLTETFVAEEIRGIRSHGADVRIISLLKPAREPVQAVSEGLMDSVWCAPALREPMLWRAQLHFLLRAPRLYLGLLVELMRQPLPRRPVSLLLKRLLVFLKAVAAAHYLESTEIQLVHAHFAWLSGGAAWVCARLLDLPFTVTVHAYDIFSHKNDLLPLVTRGAARVIAVSEYNHSQVVAGGLCPAASISVIHTGVDGSKFRDHSRRRQARIRSAKLNILSVGSLVAKKGHRYLIEACRNLAESGLEFNCTIIGGGPDETNLRNQIWACGLEDRVNLRGARLQDEVITAYLEHDVFVLSSIVVSDGDRDGIPVVLMEAGAMGLPLVSTTVSGIPELVRHGVTGWLVPPGDSAALAEAIAALAVDPELRARLAARAREWVEAEFEIHANVDKLARVLQEAIEMWRPVPGEADRQGADGEWPTEPALSDAIN